MQPPTQKTGRFIIAVCAAAAGLLLTAGNSPARAQQVAVEDSLLFTITLSEDSSSLYFSNWSDKISKSLAGPIMMADHTLLFHSENGYALYNMNGKLLDEHSLVKDNMKAAAAKKPKMYLAYPFDSETLIYYTDADTLAVYRKKIKKKGLSKVPPAEMEMFRDIKSSEPLNIYRSGTMEDVGRKASLRPHLAGFTALNGGSKWWSIDLFFSFTAPMIMETDGVFTSFFPGLREGGGNCETQASLIEPLGVFSREGRWYYLGIHAMTGSKEEEYFQTVVLCDQAGNILYCSQMLKQEITDAVLQERKDINTVFTVRKAGRHVFVPAVDPYGDIYYGIINWEWKKLEVYKRSFIRFLPGAAPPAYADKFDREARMNFLPVNIDCSNASRRGVVPEILYKDDKNSTELLDLKGLTRDGYYAMVHRLPNEELRKKVARVAPKMPKEIGAMQDSISKLPTTWCPYGISLNHESLGTLSNLDYGFGDVVICAWVMGVSRSKNVYVRVDLEDWAEVVVFTKEGRFIERFTFNNNPYKIRKDVVVLSDNEEVYERDYEAGMNAKGKASGYKFTVWKKGTLPIVPKDAPKGKDKKKKK
jgi:hypothetical protein